MPLLMLNVVAVPVDGVKVIEVGTTSKLKSPIVAGGVSETKTRLTLAVPPLPPPLPLGKPLQEATARHDTTHRKTKDLRDFIRDPAPLIGSLP